MPETADFGLLLNLAYGAFKTRLHAHMAQAGFDDLGPSYGYVFRLLQHDMLSLRDIAQSLEMTPQGALKIIDAMVAGGYVERREDAQDGRVKRLSLTPRARKAMESARHFHATFEKELATQVGERAAGAARTALESIAAANLKPARPL